MTTTTTATEPSAISVRGLSVSYEHKRILTNIFLEMEAGKTYGVIGPNGAGKSTLFKAMLGLVEANAGHVAFFGQPLAQVYREVAYVPQRSDVDWSFPATVLDVVLMGRYPYKRVFQRLNAEDKAIARDALAQLDIADLEGRQIGELSGGQQQRVFLARAICQAPRIFFLDEPLVGVDSITEDKIVALLKSLAAAGKTVLVVHHDLSSVNRYFDKVLLINQRLIAFGNTAEVFTQENIDKAYSSQLPILHRSGRGY